MAPQIPTGFRAMSTCIDLIQAHDMNADQVVAVHYAAGHEIERLTGKNPVAVALGSMTSAKKKRSSAENAKLGGRPKTQGLTPLQQRAYDLRAQGLTVREIAQHMGRQPESIRQLLARAATKLSIPGGWTGTK